MREINNVDLGSIKIHKRVLADIVRSAITEIKGVSLAAPDFLSSLGELLGIKNSPGVTVSVDKNNQVTIDVKIFVQYGMNIPELAAQTQGVIRRAIERTVDIDLKVVNVNIHGIERKK